MTTVCYYSHRLRDKDPAKQADNLARAELRCGQLRELWKRTHPERVLIAPWIDLAKAGCPEVLVWEIIDVAIKGSQVVVSDLDGAQPSKGLRDERMMGFGYGCQLETIDGEIVGET
jgi:hypothetical protein